MAWDKEGLTPAYAGKSEGPCYGWRGRWNHPRVRREESSGPMSHTPRTESPPRARGRADHAVPRALDAEITPACAGKSHSWLRMLLSSRNHPRVRGEENGWTTGLNHANRITPACAGKSPAATRETVGAMESPPRARGREQWEQFLTPMPGITPACAGKRRSTRWPPSPRRNHPRVRGEEIAKAAGIGKGTESPPRARGRADREVRGFGKGGNHPRVRGEESNENAASEDMVIPPKCKFFALFSRAALKRRVIPNAGPGAFRLSNFCLYSSLCVPA